MWNRKQGLVSSPLYLGQTNYFEVETIASWQAAKIILAVWNLKC